MTRNNWNPHNKNCRSIKVKIYRTKKGPERAFPYYVYLYIKQFCLLKFIYNIQSFVRNFLPS